MRVATINKYRAIQQMYSKLYSEGLRTDVIIPRLQKEFYYQHPESIWRILRIELPEPEETAQPAEAA